MPQILFKKNHPAAKMPTQATEHAAGFDLYSAETIYDYRTGNFIVDTGLSVAFDTGHVLLLYGRSGLAMKYGIRLANGVGVIDADYRGPLKVILRCDSWQLGGIHEVLNVGQRIAQAVLMPIPSVTWVEAKQLSETARGEGGFGSTGAQ